MQIKQSYKKFIMFIAIFQGIGVTLTMFYILVREIFFGNGNGIHVLYLNNHGEMIFEFLLLLFLFVIMVFGLKYSYDEWSVCRDDGEVGQPENHHPAHIEN